MQELNLQDILKNTTDLKDKKVWYVAIIGRPNAGKSTFINELIWEKIAITSNIPQTTRNKILAMYNDDESQIIFFDTPGIHESKKAFNAEINHQALSSLRDSELVLYFIDSARETWPEEEYIADILTKINTPVFRVYTKCDLRPVIDIPTWDDVFEVSSKDKSGFSGLIDSIKTKLPDGPILFPEDFYTKQDIYFRISEIIREKLFHNLKEELPHSVFVAVEEIEDDAKWVKKISAYIYTETDSQKYIVIGKWGTLITKVWKLARLELEEVFWQKVFLSLRAKVRKNWRKDEGFVKKMLK
jgi:GTP-binding protein Era